ncbi:hypothetical protein EDC14_1005105 [Hydrogenispora ethanolica]|uniref:Membrane protein YdfK n=1 Tax=Hydrogenispora ethanolica TaxID=1082276 RepID=A0A4R1S248_HYDET|nr:DUF554 domain-containing protein [Hydrogenispora ethanolica]TCL73243.1 hypothetical protein EDC14_1005105 [Hydrogenispora ethanolica]
MGTIINVIAILIGGAVGLLFREKFPERVTQTALQVMGLFTMLVGISMALQGKELILVLVSLAVGAMLGEWINIEARLEQLGAWIDARLPVAEGSPAKGFIYASLVFCVGSMAIVGSITDGVKGDHSILVTKAMMDGIISIPFAAGMGVGVLGSALSILIYQGGLTLLAWQLQSLFTATMIRELTAVGGIIVMGIGVNILGLQKVRVGNFLPALLIIILICYFR